MTQPRWSGNPREKSNSRQISRTSEPQKPACPPLLRTATRHVVDPVESFEGGVVCFAIHNLFRASN